MKKEMFVVLLFICLFLFCPSCSTGDLPDKGIDILSPKANDVVPTGASYEIRWKTEVSDSEFGAAVTIEFTKDGGKSWQVVDENVPNSTKRYAWKVPKLDSTQCKVRIISQRRPEYRGSSGMFVVK